MVNLTASRRAWFRTLAGACLGFVVGARRARDASEKLAEDADSNRNRLCYLDRGRNRPQITTFVYDASGRITPLTNPFGSIMTFSYDAGTVPQLIPEQVTHVTECSCRAADGQDEG